jgi:hypothetical protein
MPDSPDERVRRMIDSMLGTMTLARELVAGHRSIDIAGLDQQAGLLCAQVLDLPTAQGQALRPALHRLSDAAAALEAALAASLMERART